ncbi:MAG: hypothetical protein HY843_04865 [Bdellovibrio sp.]|nr:hypothetical protein [Bdellovibrio sp.]
MNKKGFLVLISFLFFSLQGYKSFATTLPPNSFHLLDDVRIVNNITEELFNKIIDHVVSLWAPWAELHGAKLSADKKWASGVVNAYANQSKKDWTVYMYGGLARRAELTPDGFALVVCHELGHHFGGYFFYKSSNQWAASEGQADYFATSVCAKTAFVNTPWENPIDSEVVPEFVQKNCNQAWNTQLEQKLCYRNALAGQSLANLMAALGSSGKPKFETPDTKVVTETYDYHPQAQCRLDTYFSGTLCLASFDSKLIPGKNEQTETGNNTIEAELEAAKYSCMSASGYTVGLRPTCWFKTLK